MFDKGKFTLITRSENADLSQAQLSPLLSHVGFDEEKKCFFMTVDKLLFENPLHTIHTVLDANGFVTNLENTLSCLDSFQMAIYAKVTGASKSDISEMKVKDYLPCATFQLPQRANIGKMLQTYYDEISQFEISVKSVTKTEEIKKQWAIKEDKKNESQLKQLQEENKLLNSQVRELSSQLSKEQKSLTRVSRALESQKVLPENTVVGRVERVDLKKRIVIVKSFRKLIEVPMQLMTHIPQVDTRCIMTFEENTQVPMGIFFYNQELLELPEKHIAEIVNVEGNAFKARSPNRQYFQIEAANSTESNIIRQLKRGMLIMTYVAQDYVIRFNPVHVSDQEDMLALMEEDWIKFIVGKTIDRD